MSGDDLAGLYARCLRATGATRAFRAPGHELAAPVGLDVVDVPSVALAAVLADAEGRLARAPSARPGVALLPGRRIRLSSSPGEVAPAHSLVEASELPPAIAGWTVGRAHAALEIDLDLDLTALTPEGLDPVSFAPVDARLTSLSPDLATLDTVLVVGSGVVRDGHAAGVAEAARRTGAAVVAAPGALGVLPLDDPAWAGIVGLQTRDAELAGLAEAHLLIVAGLDPSEAAVLPDDAQVVEVEPWHLELMAIRWPEPEPRTDAHRALVGALAELSATARTSDGVPLHPARAVADLAEVLGPDDLVVADGGPAGLWLQRGVVARPAGSVVVAPRSVPGFAVAAALVAGLDGRRAVAVVGDTADPVTEAVLELAALARRQRRVRGVGSGRGVERVERAP